MTFQAGATSGLRYIAEVTAGTTPATPQMIDIPITSTTLDLTIDNIDDPTLVADRMEVENSQGNRHVQGDIVAVHKYGQFDDFVEATLGGTWSSNVVKASSATGGTARSFTIEQYFNDVTKFRRFTGVRFNSWSVSGTINENMVSTFGVMGMNMATATSALDASPTAVLAKTPLKFLGGTMTVGGVAAKLTAFNMEYNNNMSSSFIMNANVASEINWTKATLSGSFTQYLYDFVNYDLFNAGTTCEIVAQATDGTNTYTITIPKAKFTAANTPVPGAGVLFQTFNFNTSKDSSLGSTMSVTRSA